MTGSFGLSFYEAHMRRAIELAEQGRGTTSPNPMVGAVIIKDDRVIAEGYHKKAGEPHAEINALNNATEDVVGATMVVSLEPCNHYGKTPPCTEAIINAGISKVIVGMIDPNPKCAGSGIKRLRDAGIKVEYGILAEQVAKQNEVFIKYITTHRPFVTVKAAISMDGKIAESPGSTTTITGNDARQSVHELRNESDAIMVGIGTVLADDPLLNTRLDRVGTKNPIRVIVDSAAKIPLESKIVQTASEIKTIVATTMAASEKNIKALRAKGVEVIEIDSWNGKVDLEVLMEELANREISSVIVEGGGRLIASLVKADLVDKYLIYVAPKLIGEQGVDFVGGNLSSIIDLRIRYVGTIGEDIFIQAYPSSRRQAALLNEARAIQAAVSKQSVI